MEFGPYFVSSASATRVPLAMVLFVLRSVTNLARGHLEFLCLLKVSMAEDDDIPQLPADTLAILEQFRCEQEERTKLESEGKTKIDEDWQLSQFWYSEDTARTLCNEAIFACQGKGTIACVSSPTLVDYFHQTKEYSSGDVKLKILEYDQRFSKRYPEEFVFYDYKEPHNLPDDIKGMFDVVVADPPFLADECLVKTAQTIRILGKKDVKIILCTGAIMEDVASRILGVRRTRFAPRHANNLANDFASFVNYEPNFLL